MGQCHHNGPSLTRDTSLHSIWTQRWWDLCVQVQVSGWWDQVSGRSTASLDCLLSKWSDSRSAFPTDSHTSPPPSLTSGGNDELKQNTVDLKVDHNLWGEWIHKTSLFLTLNWHLATEYVSLALTWQSTNSSQLTRERSHDHRRWASCLKPKACLHWSSVQYGVYAVKNCSIIIWSIKMNQLCCKSGKQWKIFRTRPRHPTITRLEID